MVTIRKRKNEDFESLLMRFKNACKREGILDEYIKRRAYKKPGVRDREKRQKALYLKNSREYTSRK